MTSDAGGSPRADFNDQRAVPGTQVAVAGRWQRAQRPLLDRSSERDAIGELLEAARGQGAPANIGRGIVAIADLHAGQCQAVDTALPVIHDDHPFTAELILPELIEAAVRSHH